MPLEPDVIVIQGSDGAAAQWQAAAVDIENVLDGSPAIGALRPVGLTVKVHQARVIVSDTGTESSRFTAPGALTARSR